MSRVMALARMRLVAYAGTQRALAPLLAVIALVLVAHGGGVSSANQAYAFSATLLFAAFGWQTKLVLDTEADEQRLLSRLCVGSGPRELVAGLLAATIVMVPEVAFAVFVPAAIGAVSMAGSPLSWLGFGIWVHLLAAACALGVGALASRPVVRSAGWSTMLLVAAPVAVLVFGSRDAAFPRWLVPQLVAAADIAHRDDLASIGLVTASALAWAAVLLAGYAALRRSRP